MEEIKIKNGDLNLAIRDKQTKELGEDETLQLHLVFIYFSLWGSSDLLPKWTLPISTTGISSYTAMVLQFTEQMAVLFSHLSTRFWKVLVCTSAQLLDLYKIRLIQQVEKIQPLTHLGDMQEFHLIGIEIKELKGLGKGQTSAEGN